MNKIQNNTVKHNIKFYWINKILEYLYKVEEKILNYAKDERFTPTNEIEKGYNIVTEEHKLPKEIKLKPFQKEQVTTPNWKLLLMLKKEQNIEIKPITRRLYGLRTKAKECRKCGAPSEYLRNHGFYRPKKKNEIFPRHTCKICSAEYAPGASRHSPPLKCPWCNYALSKDHKMSYGNICVCKNKKCLHKEKYEQRYNEVEWDILDNNTVYTNTITGFNKIKVSDTVVNEILFNAMQGIPGSLNIVMLERKFKKKIVRSQQTILNIVHKMAKVIREHKYKIELPLSGFTFEDETYIKAKGKWKYLFRILDIKTGVIVEDLLNHERNGLGAISSHLKYFKLAKERKLKLKTVTDSSHLYPLTYSYAKQNFNLNIEHIVVQGLDDSKYPSEYRGTKQAGERQFGELKAILKRKRGFSSFKGAEDFLTLYSFYCNHIDKRNGDPPCLLRLKNGKPITEWIEVIQYFKEQEE